MALKHFKTSRSDPPCHAPSEKSAAPWRRIPHLLPPAYGSYLVLYCILRRAGSNEITRLHALLNKADTCLPVMCFADLYCSTKHTVTEVTIDGKIVSVAKDRAKTKSSLRTLPLVEPFEQLLLLLKAEQAVNRRVCGNMYCGDYFGYVYVNELGERIKPNFITQNFAITLANNNLKKFVFTICAIAVQRCFMQTA